MTSSLIILDDSSDISYLVSKMKNFPHSKIISFDFMTHESLLHLGLEYEKIEDYFEIGDHELINNLAIEKSLSWYKQKEISAYLQFEDLNLGWLLENELPPYFLKVIKNFLALIRMIHKEKPTHVITSDSIGSMIKEIDKKHDISIQSIPTKNITTNLDRVVLTINLGGKNIPLWIPRMFALKIAKLLESFASNIFDFKFNLNNASKRDSVLLLNLSPSPHVDLLEALSKLNKNILLLNDSGPAVWNLKNLDIVKRFHLKILKMRDFSNEIVLAEIDKKQQEMIKNINNMSSAKLFNEIFSILEISFWPLIKKNFIDKCLLRFNDAIERYVIAKNLLIKSNTKCILVLYNQNLEEKIILHMSKLFNIHSISIQHGLSAMCKPGEKLLPFDFPPFQSGTKYAIWGKNMKKFITRQNTVNEKDILLAGNPRYDQFFRIKNTCKYNGVILLASNFLQNYYGVSQFDTNMIIKHQKTFENICRISNDIKGKTLTVKLHPGVIPMYDVKPILEKINPMIPIYKTQSIIDLMKDCDILVCIDHSSILLEAMILGKPTITFMVDSNYYEDDEIITSGATLSVKTYAEFEKALTNILFDMKFRNDLIEKGTKFVNESMVNQGNSSEFLTQIVEKYSIEPKSIS